MSVRPFSATLLNAASVSTSRSWVAINFIEPISSVIVSGLESGGHVQVWVSNVPSPPTALPVAGDGTVQWDEDIMQDSALEISGTYFWVCMIKTVAGSEPTRTMATLYGLRVVERETMRGAE